MTDNFKRIAHLLNPSDLETINGLYEIWLFFQINNIKVMKIFPQDGDCFGKWMWNYPIPCELLMRMGIIKLYIIDGPDNWWGMKQCTQIDKQTSI